MNNNFIYEKFESIYTKTKNRLSEIKKYSLDKLPDRTKIFLSALWFWVYLTFIFNKFIGCVLGFVLTYTPDSCINPSLSSSLSFSLPSSNSNILNKKEDEVPQIINAKLGTETITNKFKMLMKSQWDNEISDLGGINVSDIVSKYPALSSSVIWISYLFKVDKKLQTMSDEEIGKAVKYMLINITDKVIYRESSLEDEEEILFGEIPF